MSNANKSGRPSFPPVISKPISNKSTKINLTQITKPANAYPTQASLSRSSNISKTSPSTITPHTPTPPPLAPSISEIPTSSDITNEGINTYNNSHNTRRNYASAAANGNYPSREQALVFNSIDGIPQKDYIVAIGKIISPKNIVFVSRISNNRFCIFLSSKQILDSLLEFTQTISINEKSIQIRRLINPSKRIVISNVCPSIPNHVILEALKNINVTPLSDIAYLKAGINIEGYEHILSFRRQMYIKHEDAPNLPGSLPLLHNHTEFRIFFTDDKITCFICKSTGHTSHNCKIKDTNPLDVTKLTQPDPVEEPLVEGTPSNSITNIDSSETEVPSPSSVISNNISFKSPQKMEGITEDHQADKPLHLTHLKQNDKIENHPTSFDEPQKRPLSDASSIATHNSSPPSNSNADRSRNISKKAKVERSRSNSSSKITDKLSSGLKPAEDIFSNNSPISLQQFTYVLDNYIYKNLNIHSICKDINSDITSLMLLIDLIRPKITERTIKAQLTRLANFLFQALPPPPQDN